MLFAAELTVQDLQNALQGIKTVGQVSESVVFLVSEVLLCLTVSLGCVFVGMCFGFA